MVALLSPRQGQAVCLSLPQLLCRAGRVLWGRPRGVLSLGPGVLAPQGAAMRALGSGEHPGQWQGGRDAPPLALTGHFRPRLFTARPVSSVG